MSNRAVPGPYQAERVRANFEPSLPWPLSSRAILSRCRAEQGWADDELPGPGRTGQANVELNEPEPMLSGVGLNRCQVERDRVDVELIWPGPMLS